MILVRSILALLTVGVFITPVLVDSEFLFEIERPQAGSFQQSVEPEPISIYCPGGLVQQGGVSGTEIGKYEIVSAAKVSVIGAQTTSFEIPDEIESGVLIESTSISTEQSTLNLAANILSKVSEKRMSGLAALNCAQPAYSGVLLSGDSSAGSESLLVISNPNQIETVVTLSLLGVEEEKNQSLVLAPKEQAYVSLATLAGDSKSYAIRFESSAGAVSAVIQQRNISGLSPTGVELSDWVIEPKNLLTYPVVKVIGSGLAPEKELAAPVLRLFNEADIQAEVSILLLSEQDRKSLTLSLEPGELLDTQLELTDGDWSAFVESSEPIFSAIKNPTFTEVADFEWLLPANEIEQNLAMSIPVNGQLHLANPTNAVVVYQIENFGEIALSPSSRKTIDVPASNLIIRSGASIWAAVTMLNESGYAVIEPRENRNFGADIEVLVD